MLNKRRTSLRCIWKYVSILSIVAAFLFFNTTSQIKAEPFNELIYVPQDTVKIHEEPASKDSTQLIDYVETIPQFPGGDIALLKFLSENINYPEEAAEQGIQGRVVLRFVIKANGSIGKIEVFKSLYPKCDEEAIRVVKMMPKWIPAKQNGKPTNIYYHLPVVFKIPKNVPVNKTDSVQDIPVISQEKYYSKDSTQIIYSKVETMPQFPGGDMALLKFLSKNINYPREAIMNEIQGRVALRFTVTPDGSIENIEIQKSLYPICDREALRVVKKMPKWIPGKQDGIPVYVDYTLLITLSLPDSR